MQIIKIKAVVFFIQFILSIISSFQNPQNAKIAVPKLTYQSSSFLSASTLASFALRAASEINGIVGKESKGLYIQHINKAC